MTHRPKPADPRKVEGLRAFGDDLAEGRARPADNAFEDTMLRAQRALAANRLTVLAMPGSTRHAIWEDLMHAQSEIPVANQGFRRVADVVSARSQTVSPLRPRDSRFVRIVARWQPAISFAVVAAFLVGLIGVAYQRGVLEETGAPIGPTGTDQVGQVIATPDSAQPFGACEANGGTQLSDDDLRSMSITDWQVPAYVVAQPVPPEIGQRAASAYSAYQACLFERFDAGSDEPTDEELSYLSDRLRFVLLYDTLSSEQQAEIDTWRERNPIPRMISDFPLPLNRTDFGFAEFTGGTFTTDFFLAGDVYALPDGRYAAIIGGVSTHMLRTGQPIRSGDGELYFVAFADQDGALFVDETFTICPSDFVLDAQEAGTAPSDLDQDTFVTQGRCSG